MGRFRSFRTNASLSSTSNTVELIWVRASAAQTPSVLAAPIVVRTLHATAGPTIFWRENVRSRCRYQFHWNARGSWVSIQIQLLSREHLTTVTWSTRRRLWKQASNVRCWRRRSHNFNNNFHHFNNYIANNSHSCQSYYDNKGRTKILL